MCFNSLSNNWWMTLYVSVACRFRYIPILNTTMKLASEINFVIVKIQFQGRKLCALYTLMTFESMLSKNDALDFYFPLDFSLIIIQENIYKQFHMPEIWSWEPSAFANTKQYKISKRVSCLQEVDFSVERSDTQKIM